MSGADELLTYKNEWSKYGQEHCFKFVDQLSGDQLSKFTAQVKDIDISDVDRIYKQTIQNEAKNMRSSAHNDIRPFTSVTKCGDASREQREKWEQIGLGLIADNKVAVLLLAGGQASRLGCTFPKGMYDLGLPSKKSLYQLQVERAIKIQSIASQRRKDGNNKGVINWYIMTSPATYAETLSHFKSNNFFGQPESQFFFFNQHMQPCVTPSGLILLESASSIAVAPNGNGGLYKALHKSGAIEDMKKKGVEYVAQYCVDNALIRVADPVFLGFMHDTRADCAAKVIPKAYPEEPVGVMALVNGTPNVIEYSEVEPELRNLRDDSGQLVFNYSHICINSFTRQFLQDMVQHLDELPYHIAKKKIPSANEQGIKTPPEKENGWKLEMFIFDAFQYAKKMVAFECLREEEFSPLKNGAGAGKDCPETCLADICRLHTKYIVKAGGTIEDNKGEVAFKPTLVEVSPLVSYCGEHLESFVKDRSFTCPVHISL